MERIEIRRLGKSDVIVPAMGVGTMLWLPNNSKAEEEFMKTFSTCVDNGLNFFDTAEIYGNGKSESILGKCIKKDGRPVILASKFAIPSTMIPPQKRIKNSANSPRALMEALDNSLERLGVDHIDLYQLHAPPSKNSINDYVEIMAEAVKMGKVRAVGVCNFSGKQIREAYTALAKYNIPLATAMVGYNLIRRWPETNGIFNICKELGVTLIPYAPLAEGILTGKYRLGNKKAPIGYVIATYFGHLNITKERTDNVPLIKRIFTRPKELNKKKMEILFQEMDNIANAYGKTLAQVAINWFISNEDINIIPIPGMKNIRQVNDNMGSLGWKLTKEERAALDNAEVATHN
jgi:aryl-alcohol dehydrogenase-like predicted oxidoreductase